MPFGRLSSLPEMQSSRQISQMGCLPWRDSWPSLRALPRRSCQSIEFSSAWDVSRQPVFQLPRQPTWSMWRACGADMVTISRAGMSVPPFLLAPGRTMHDKLWTVELCRRNKVLEPPLLLTIRLRLSRNAESMSMVAMFEWPLRGGNSKQALMQTESFEVTVMTCGGWWLTCLDSRLNSRRGGVEIRALNVGSMRR